MAQTTPTRSTPEATAVEATNPDDGQSVGAGRCADPLAVNAGALGFYRVAYDAATLARNTAAFASLPNGDRIALLDDQWALVRAGKAKRPTYLALAAAMGDDDDARAWNQIISALSRIEIDERGTPGYEKFLSYARSIIKPVATRLSWNATPGETPGETPGQS